MDISDETKEIIDKTKKCLIASYDLDIITQEEMGILWNYITNLQDRINKAIELLNDWNYLDKIDCYCEPKEVIEILQGKSDE